MNDRKIISVLDDEFKKYGSILEDFNPTVLDRFMEKQQIPDGITYVASSEELESMEIAKYFETKVFGGIPIQIGYACGHNTLLHAAEYHKSTEVLVAITDLLLILGQKKDITSDYTYDTRLMEIFIVPAGITVELDTSTLHYAPCDANDQGFKCVAVMTRGSNTENQVKHGNVGEDKLLFATNKWLIAHPDSGLGEQGAFVGLIHENISVG